LVKALGSIVCLGYDQPKILKTENRYVLQGLKRIDLFMNEIMSLIISSGK